MITIDYIRGRGVSKNSKNDYVILEQPLSKIIVVLYLYMSHVI